MKLWIIAQNIRDLSRQFILKLVQQYAFLGKLNGSQICYKKDWEFEFTFGPKIIKIQSFQTYQKV